MVNICEELSKSIKKVKEMSMKGSGGVQGSRAEACPKTCSNIQVCNKDLF